MQSMIFRSLACAAMLTLGASMAAAQERSVFGGRGESLLSQHCAMCHAISRFGSSPHPKAPPFRSLSERYPIESLAESLGEGLVSGHPEMPEFVFPPNDVGAIIRYLRSIQKP